jgi:hypothetical protein
LSSTFLTARVSGSHFLNIQLVKIPMPIVSMRKQDTWMHKRKDWSRQGNYAHVWSVSLSMIFFIPLLIFGFVFSVL